MSKTLTDYGSEDEYTNEVTDDCEYVSTKYRQQRLTVGSILSQLPTLSKLQHRKNIQ